MTPTLSPNIPLSPQSLQQAADDARRPFLHQQKHKVANLRSANIGDRVEEQYKVQRLNDGFYLYLRERGSGRPGCLHNSYRSCLAFCSRERLSPITDMAYGKDRYSYCSAIHNLQKSKKPLTSGSECIHDVECIRNQGLLNSIVGS